MSRTRMTCTARACARRAQRGAASGVIAWALALSACDASPVLYLGLRTDYRAGVDFTLVQVRQGDETLELARADASRDYAQGVRIASLSAGDVGAPFDVEIELLDRDQVVLAARTVRIARAPSRSDVVTVLLTRSCAAVTCPLDDASATECLVGQCVSPTCVDPRECASSQCTSDPDCVREPGTCARSRCAEGACVAVPDDAQCVAPAVCSVASGRCVTPSGVNDAGVTDPIADLVRCQRRARERREYVFCLSLGLTNDRAHEACRRLELTLLRIDDAAEQAWVLATAESLGGFQRPPYLDGSDRAVEGEWRYSDGTLFWRDGPQNGLYANWSTDEPNGSTDEEDCVILYGNGTWNDSNCVDFLPVICESP